MDSYAIAQQRAMATTSRNLACALRVAVETRQGAMTPEDVCRALCLGTRADGSMFLPSVLVLADVVSHPSCRAVDAGCGMCACSRCGAEAWADRDSVTNYCPECGAEVVG